MNEEGKLTPNADAWIIKRIFEGYAAGMNLKEICDVLNAEGAKRLRSDNPFIPITVWRILRNEKYVGDLRLQKEAPTDYLTKKPLENAEYTTYLVENEHEGIISREIWDTVQERIRAAERDRATGLCRNKTKTHYFYGIVYCAECGSPMIRRSYTNQNKTKYKAWNCRGRQKQKNGCRNPAIREDDLIAEIVSALSSRGVEIYGEDEETITANVRMLIDIIHIMACFKNFTKNFMFSENY